MKRQLYLFLLFAAVTLSGMAQTIGEAFYIYRNDGQFNAFYRDEVQSIEYSYEDAAGNTYDEIVTQIITTTDSVYRIPIASIEKVEFVQPETIYNSQVVHMESMLPYIVSVDGLNIFFSSSIPSNLMPKVGDILLHDSFESELMPEGFSGRVIQSSGQQVVCESVSFEDIYEQIVCYGSYTAVDDGTNRSLHLVPRKVGGSISSAINISGTLGSSGSGIYCSANGKLSLSLRTTFKYINGTSPFFDLSLSPDLRVKLDLGIRGNYSNNFFENKDDIISLPIPDTPFLLKLKGGPSLKASVKASVTISTETALGYKFGVKYEDGKFKGYGQNTSKWFSMPDVDGSISGSIFAGVQTEFGVFSYGDLLSLSLNKEAGAEFVANLTENLLNSDKYEELQNAKFDLNLKASVGVSAKAKYSKWLIASANWTLLSGQLNINSWKLVPKFQKPEVIVNNATSADISVNPSEKLLFPVSIGLCVWEEDSGNLQNTLYSTDTYRVLEDWPHTQFQATFSNLSPSKNYVVHPMVKLLGVEKKATPSETFQTGENTCPDGNHPHMIDLGLPSGTKWACCNVGATKPEDYGEYFAWGEIHPKGEYNWDTYIYCDGYGNSCHDIGSDIAGTRFDAATANWDAGCMPSLLQCEELINNCTSSCTTQNDVNGLKFTGPNGKSVFFPAAGSRWDDSLRFGGSCADYWSSTLKESYPRSAYILTFCSPGGVEWNSDYRGGGRSVRPVNKGL